MYLNPVLKPPYVPYDKRMKNRTMRMVTSPRVKIIPSQLYNPQVKGLSKQDIHRERVKTRRAQYHQRNPQD